LPFPHFVRHRIGDPADQVGRNLQATDILVL
jgi:hypothetical protein